MDYRTAVKRGRGDVEGLERLYREGVGRGEGEAFVAALGQVWAAYPDELLLRAWGARLDLSLGLEGEGQDRRRHWKVAVGLAFLMGGGFALLAWGEPSIPVPGVATTAFWVGWSAVVGWGVLGFAGVLDAGRLPLYCKSAAAVALVGGIALVLGWGRTDDEAGLMALHLPVVIWGLVGWGAVRGRSDWGQQFHAFAVKSVEVLLAAGIFLGAGVLLFGLTMGIFAVLGVRLPETLGRVVGAWGLGAVPLLALASGYDPRRAPAAQLGAEGLGRLLGVVTRAVLPLALGVLAVYLLYFVPQHFWRPFAERQVLIVYNATVLAVLGLAVCLVGSARTGGGGWLRWGLLAALVLTWVLNAYALAAVGWRTYEGGLTPNRHAVLGWNLVTLYLLGHLAWGGWRGAGDWDGALRRIVGRGLVPVLAWCAWVVLATALR